MKIFAFAGIFAASFLGLLALPSCSDSERAPQSRVEAVSAAASVLSGVHDKATADAAADKIAALFSSLEKFEKTPEENVGAAEGAVRALASQCMRVEHEECFGSEKLEKALHSAE